MTVDKDELKQLRNLAEAAMKGPWRVVNGNEGSPDHRPLWLVQAEHQTDDEGMELHVGVLQDAEFIAAASPDVVLGLLAENERLQADRDKLHTALLRVRRSYDTAGDGLGYDRQLDQAIEDARSVLDETQQRQEPTGETQ